MVRAIWWNRVQFGGDVTVRPEAGHIRKYWTISVLSVIIATQQNTKPPPELRLLRAQCVHLCFIGLTSCCSMTCVSCSIHGAASLLAVTLTQQHLFAYTFRYLYINKLK